MVSLTIPSGTRGGAWSERGHLVGGGLRLAAISSPLIVATNVDLSSVAVSRSIHSPLPSRLLVLPQNRYSYAVRTQFQALQAGEQSACVIG